MCVLGPNCSQWCRYPGPQDVWSTDCAASACPGSVVGRAGGYAPGAGSGPVQAARGAAWLGWAADTSVRKPGRSGASSPLFSHRMTKGGWSTILSGGSQGHNCNHPVVDVEVWLKWCLQGYPSTAARPDHAGALYRWGWGGRQRQILAQRKRLPSSLPTPPATEECLRCNTDPFLSAASPQVPAAAGIAPDSLMVVQMSGHECWWYGTPPPRVSVTGGGSGVLRRRAPNTFPQSKRDGFVLFRCLGGYTSGYGGLGLYADPGPPN